MSSEKEKEEQFIAQDKYKELEDYCKGLEAEKKDLNTQVLQLREALKQVNAGITKASETLTEGIARISDQNMINNIMFGLIKHHPTTFIVKYKGNEIIAAYGEGKLEK